MSAYVNNLTINTHVDFSEDLELENTDGLPKDLTGHTASSFMRKNPDSSTHYEFTVGITSAKEGKINLSMGSTMTATLKPGRHVYDLLLIRPNSERSIVLEGSVLVRAGVSTGCP